MASVESSNYIKFLAIRMSPDGSIDDNIEVISTQYEILDKQKQQLRKPRKSIIDELKIWQDEMTRKKLTRGIMLIGGIFILLSGILLIVSLNMSKDIDEVVRNSNALLRTKTDTPKPTIRPPNVIDATEANSTIR